MLDKFRRLSLKIRTDKRFVVPFAIYLGTAVLVSFVFIYWQEKIQTFVPIFLIAGLSVIVLFTWSLAAFAVFRSLMVIGAGLSLILFIAQSYCALDISHRVSNNSLQSLIGMSLIFISITFGVRLYRELFGDLDAKREFDKRGALQVFRDANKGKDSILFLIFYASFMGLILGQLFQVLYPLFSSLCIYQ